MDFVLRGSAADKALRMSHAGPCGTEGDVMSYRDLSFPHDAVHALAVLFVLLALIVALLIAEQPQGLRALQLDLKLLPWRRKCICEETVLSRNGTQTGRLNR